MSGDIKRCQGMSKGCKRDVEDVEDVDYDDVENVEDVEVVEGFTKSDSGAI